MTESTAGVDALIHIASPMSMDVTPQQMVQVGNMHLDMMETFLFTHIALQNAIVFTQRIIDHALAAGVKKIVATGSLMALARLTELTTTDRVLRADGMSPKPSF